jgi:hypothetical protein
LFDFELARSWGRATPLLDTRDASDREAYPSLPSLERRYRDNSEEKMLDDRKFKASARVHSNYLSI